MEKAKITKPIFIIGCPQSGATLLFAILSHSKELWSSYRESHFVWQKFLPDKRDPLFSMYLDENDVEEGDRDYIESQYNLHTFNCPTTGACVKKLFATKFGFLLRPLYPVFAFFVSFIKGLFVKEYRVIDQTPPNTYRVSYIKKIFPDAKFIYVTREGKSNISSLIDGWKSDKQFDFNFRKFYDYNKDLKIKGYDGNVWKFTNPPGWEDYMQKPLEDICAFQWLSAQKYAQDAFDKMNPEDHIRIRYEDLVTNPEGTCEELCEFLELEYSDEVAKVASNPPTISITSKVKWVKNRDLIENVIPKIDQMQEKLGYSHHTSAVN